MQGSPLIPPSYLTIYFAGFLVLLGILYAYFYFKKRPVLLWHKVQLLVVLTVFIKIAVIGGGAMLSAYWLIPAPRVHATRTADSIEILFDRPLERRLLEKSISPEAPGRWEFENSLYATHLYRKLVFHPTYSLKPNTTYTVRLTGIRNFLGVSKPYEHEFRFTTDPSPEVSAVTPSNGQNQIEHNTHIVVTLDRPTNNLSEFIFRFEPHVEFDTKLDSSGLTYTLTPRVPLVSQTTYRLFVEKSDITINTQDGTLVERGPVMEIYSGSFTTKQPTEGHFGTIMRALKKEIKVSSITPQNGWTAVNVQSPVKLAFTQEVDHKSAEAQFRITPPADGTLRWEGNSLVFMPFKPLAFSTTYTVSHSSGFQSSFTTQNATTKLAVPAYLQKYTLSCEIASLRMALNFRGVNVTEDELIPKVGQDPTAHRGSVWGDPNRAFVGNIAGTQMKDGYGVHWAPIAKAAQNYRSAQAFEKSTIEAVTAEILKGNPVIIWTYSHNGIPTSWKTPDGTTIYAVADEHAVVVVGFVGPANNPAQIIVNDPLSGQEYWSQSSFNKKWNIFERSGVVVY